MRTAEETASLLASLASFSLFPTSKDKMMHGVTLSASGDGQHRLERGKRERREGNWTNAMRMSWPAIQNTSLMGKTLLAGIVLFAPQS